jgi:hypothetical protein
MKCNVSPIDAGIRAGLGLLLLSSPLLELKTYPYNYFGLVLIVTALAGYCPLYSAFKRRSAGAGIAERHALGHS